MPKFEQPKSQPETPETEEKRPEEDPEQMTIEELKAEIAKRKEALDGEEKTFKEKYGLDSKVWSDHAQLTHDKIVRRQAGIKNLEEVLRRKRWAEEKPEVEE